MFLLHPAVALIVVAVLGWLANTLIPLPAAIKSILNVVLALIVVGIALELINTCIPMAGSIKAILNVVVVVATCVRVVQAVGLWDRIVGLWRSFTNRHPLSE
jgi:hypothetical protein